MGGKVEARQAAVKETVARVREIEAAHGLTRATLAKIEAELIRLTARKDLFGKDEFPNPEPGQPAKLYLLSEDVDGRFLIYLTCANPGGNVRPHNHGTWAVVAGLSGIEANTFFTRVSGGTEPGPAEIAVSERVDVRDGESVAMLPDEIHNVATPGDKPRRHFHMYGISLEALLKRLAYDAEAGTCAYMEINPKIVRVPHA